MTEFLTPAAWTHRADLAGLVAALGEGNARYVGGAVRDTLLGLPVADIDMATVLPPQEVIARCEAAGIRTVPTGLAHGTVTAVLPGGPVEITTLRHDIATDGRHAEVAFGAGWREDAARRDFTINALYADPVTREISDYFGGLDDLAARRIRFIGDARLRIREDHLRILRYFRFQARYGSYPAEQMSEHACAKCAAMLMGLSRERIGQELMKLLALTDPGPTVTRMAELGVLHVILPEADAAPLRALIAAEAREGVAPAAIRRLAAMLPADPAMAKQIASRLRFSLALKKRLMGAARRGDTSETARALAYRVGMEEAADHLLLTGASLAPLAGWTPPSFPLKGGAIVARGVSAGPDVARILREVETRWVAENFPDAARVQALLAETLAETPGA